MMDINGTVAERVAARAGARATTDLDDLPAQRRRSPRRCHRFLRNS
ncbi:hypothetical protein [Kineosporia mesophila]